MRLPLSLLLATALPLSGLAMEYHVATNGDDAGAGTQAAPFRTIQHAADLAQPGDVITVHTGIYRERINPPRGGDGDASRIVYRAAPGEKVEIAGSELVRDWQPAQADTWKVVLPNSFFGGFNPYSDLIHGDWFDSRGRPHHTGAVYLNGAWIEESATLGEVLKPAGGIPLWFAQVDKDRTTIWAQFKGANPNHEEVEINVRQTVFYPDKPGRNYITVRGFTLRDAATPWSPPTAGQIGLIGTDWSKGWIIEDNVIRHSACAGVTLGKYGDQWDNTSAEAAAGYVKTIDRAAQAGWSKENIGHHIVRGNDISECEQAGIAGSLGAIFSSVTGNTIHDIHVQKLYAGAEMAGIKFHGAIDVEIRGNHIYGTVRGLWLDWMAQGARVTGNLFDHNGEDIFVEVNHGPFLVDNNLLLSPSTLLTLSQGGAYAHNLFHGTLRLMPADKRQTPFLKPHSTEVAGYSDNPLGGDRYYNNIFVSQGCNLAQYNKAALPSRMDGNVFLKGAAPSRQEARPLVLPGCDPGIDLITNAGETDLLINLSQVLADPRIRPLVTGKLLGVASISKAPYENPDGSPLTVGTDYSGKQRNPANPTPGPFESPGAGPLRLKVW